ncbi:MAG: polysaccharide deacetylase family protein [Deltaproteobacteria bacterium]|nr:polysaccharide deacetylase family protein [Deltaproteobacteria bacterium]
MAMVALGLSGDATAKGWPTPAAGESASGDIELVLTFDDGPNPTTTPQVLDILKAHKIKAIFFLVGEMADSRDKRIPKILDRMLADGHVIANHTMRHKDLCRVKEDKAVEDLDKGKEAIERATKFELAWLRLPFGVRCDRVDQMLADRKVKHFHWDLDPQEWKHGDTTKTVNYVTKELTRAGGRAVLLLHDIKKVTVEALPQILKWIDEENARREKSRKMKIRILQAPALAAEQLPKGLLPWLADATDGARALPQVLASLLP